MFDKKLLCYLGLHDWAYHYIPNSKGYTEWRVCKRCKREFYTTDYYNLWHRLYPGMMYYRDPEYIIKGEKNEMC